MMLYAYSHPPLMLLPRHWGPWDILYMSVVYQQLARHNIYLYNDTHSLSLYIVLGYRNNCTNAALLSLRNFPGQHANSWHPQYTQACRYIHT